MYYFIIASLIHIMKNVSVVDVDVDACVFILFHEIHGTTCVVYYVSINIYIHAKEKLIFTLK